MACTGMDANFSGCHLKGLPIGIPFKSNYSNQQVGTTLPGDRDACVFIILPLKMSETLEAVESDIINLESDADTIQQELVNKLVFTDWSFTPAGGCYWKAQNGQLSPAESCTIKVENETTCIEQNSKTIADTVIKSKSCQCVKCGKRFRKRKHKDCSGFENSSKDQVSKIARSNADETIGKLILRAWEAAQAPNAETDNPGSRQKKIILDSDLDVNEDLNTESEQASADIVEVTNKTVSNINSKTRKQKTKGRLQTLKRTRLSKKKALPKGTENTEKDTKIKARQLKKKEQEEKKLNRIKIKLEDHTDKYRVDVMGSFSRKDRGKAKEDCKTELLLCTLCENFRAKSKDIMESHIECHLNGDLNCDECEYMAVSVLLLRKHQREEHRKNIFICSECGAETTGQEGLKDHMGKIHAKPQYPCKLCFSQKGEKFACETKVSFRQHLRTEHPDKMVSCEACKRLFKNEYQLRKHQTSNCPGDGKKDYPCEICGQTYSTFTKVQLHITRVHNKVKTFKCELCPFVTGRKHGLRDHMYTHTGNHPFKCEQCTFSCVRGSQLISHKRTHTGEKPYTCGTCKFAAAWNVQLRDHLKVHTLPSCVECQRCGVAFKDGRALKSHEVREHPAS